MKLHDSLTFDNVGTNGAQTAYCNVPIGRRIHYIGLEIGNNLDSAFDAIVGDIRVLVDDNVQREVNATELEHVNKGNGPKYAARVVNVAAAGGDRTILPIFFSTPWSKLARDQEGTALTTNWARSLRLEVDLLALGTTRVLKAFYVSDDVTSKEVPFIEKWKRVDTAVNDSKVDITTFDKDELYSALTFFNPTGATITRAQIKHFGREAYDLERNHQAGVNQHLYEMSETATVLSDDLQTTMPFRVPFDGSGLFEDSMPGSGLEKIRLTFSGAATGSVRTIQQRIGRPD